jgi:hypothetical protein
VSADRLDDVDFDVRRIDVAVVSLPPNRKSARGLRCLLTNGAVLVAALAE